MIVIDTLFFTVVNRGTANTVLKRATELGATGGTILLGEGTAPSKVLDLLGLTEMRKELLIIHCDQEFSVRFHEELKESFELDKRNRGIAFSIPFAQYKLDNQHQKVDTKEEAKHTLILTVVDEGTGSKVVKASWDAGARGGTIIHGHGAGTPGDFYFPIVVEPYKDIVLTVTPNSKREAIQEQIKSALNLDEIGTGVLFTLPITQITGLYEDRNGESS